MSLVTNKRKNVIKNKLKNTNEKNAARTIKRIVLKKQALGHYRKFTGAHSTNIKAGKNIIASTSLFRRMKTYPITSNKPLYRGLTGENIYNKFMRNGKLNNSFASFALNNKNVALEFASGSGSGKKGFVIILPPGRYPGINSKKFGGGGFSEREVTLAPGTYTINKNKNIATTNYNVWGNGSLTIKIPSIHVKYKPSNTLTYVKYN
jgi:hypothetical protein